MMDEKALERIADQASRMMAAGWRGNPHMSGDDRNFMSPSMRRRHDDKARTVVEFVLQALSPGSTGETDGWVPIDTAPKDGTVVDIWAGKRIANCQWRDDGYYEAGWWFGDHGRILDGFATHWRPLPSPPSAMLAAAGGENG